MSRHLEVTTKSKAKYYFNIDERYNTIEVKRVGPQINDRLLGGPIQDNTWYILTSEWEEPERGRQMKLTFESIEPIYTSEVTNIKDHTEQVTVENF